MENNKNILSVLSGGEDTVYILCESAVTDEDVNSMKIIDESVVNMPDGTKKQVVTIDTILQRFEVPNFNGRIYGRDIVMDAIDNDPLIQADLAHKAWVGEYGHPLDATPQRQVIFYPPNLSHRILTYRCEGDLLTAHVQTLAGGNGELLCGRILQGMPAAFSLRSLGSIDLATRRVKSPLKVLTYDAVNRPSHVEAYQREIISESAGATVCNESAVVVPIKESFEDLKDYIAERSVNVQTIADMFNLDRVNLVLAENGRVNMVLDETVTLSVPLDKAIALQTKEMFSSFKGLIKR